MNILNIPGISALKFSSLPELESYLEEFNQQDHQFILSQRKPKIPSFTDLPEEGEKNLPSDTFNWQRELGDDRLFPELKYELLMSVEPNGKPMLLPDISDGDIIGYKISKITHLLFPKRKMAI